MTCQIVHFRLRGQSGVRVGWFRRRTWARVRVRASQGCGQRSSVKGQELKVKGEGRVKGESQVKGQSLRVKDQKAKG